MSLNLSEVLPPSLQPLLQGHKHLAALWSSFGSIYRLTLKSPPTSLVLKHVDPPLDSRSESHLRKIISYRVERYFYAHLASRLPASVRVAAHYPVQDAYEDTTLLLEDLTPSFPQPAARRGALGETQAVVVLKWLAGFHATYWESTGGIPDTAPPMQVEDPATTDGVWQNGGYWYLDTRHEEFIEIKDDPEYVFLSKNNWARKVADRLQDPSRPGRTLVHGDMKAANIVFNKELKNCAVYDFQYLGKGLGVVDLVYFLGTSVDGSLMRNEAKVEELLDVYYKELSAQVSANGGELGKYTRNLLRSDLDLAIVDWFRFMAGWGFWGNSFCSASRVKGIIAGLEKQEI